MTAVPPLTQALTRALPRARRVEHVMGMPVSLVLRGRHVDDTEAEVAWRTAMAVLHRADEVFSTYRSDSATSRLDRGDITLEACPPEVAEVLTIGERARRESGGAFDVRRTATDGHRHLDPSGVVKGWAVQRASRALAELPDTDFCLSAGGDMVCRTATDAPPWRIGIEDPRDPARVLAVVPVRNGAVATSGTVHRGTHITDARTGRTATSLASVTVTYSDLVWADIDATTAFALGPDARTWLATRPGRRGLLVWPDGRAETFGG